MKIAALLPMRHYSERIKGKNYRPFVGLPLYHHIMMSLVKCPLINEIIIDTDSPIIVDDAKTNFPAIRIIKRPEHLLDGNISMNTILLHDISQVEADWYIQTHSTNPMLKADTITNAITALLNALPNYDSLFSVTKVQSRFWTVDNKPLNHDPSILKRTQDLSPIFEENSNIYIFNKEILKARNNRIGFNPLMFEIPRHEAIDIDEELDFLIAESIYEKIYL
jgi:CMP-N-acetylneuraminic acid synthetase